MCRRCHDRLWDWLINIPDVYALLSEDELLERAVGEPTAGKPQKRDASPAPGRISVMDARDERRTGDEYQGTLGVLAAWADLIREERGLKGHTGNAAARTVVGETELLKRHLDHAVAQDWIADMWEEIRRLHGRLTTLTYSTHPGEKANAACFECGDVLVRSWREVEPCRCGPRPSWPKIPGYPAARDHSTIQTWLAVRNRLVADHELSKLDWIEGHRGCDQGGLAEGWQCRGCREEYSPSRYWLAIKEDLLRKQREAAS